MTKRINSVIKQVLFIACILLMWAEPGFSAVSRVQLVRDSLVQNVSASIQQHYSIYHDENLGFLNFAEALDQTAKGTQLKNDLLRNPDNQHVLEGLTSADPELYAQVLADLGRLAQDKFGLNLSDITFYDAQQTTSLSLADTLLNDVRGGAVAVEAMVLLLPEDELGQMQVPGFGEGLSPQETWSTILLMADVYESLRLGLGGKPATNAEDVSGTPGYVVNDESGLGSSGGYQEFDASELGGWNLYSESPVHHICTDKNCISTASGGPWTPVFEEIFKNAGLDLNDAINKVAVPGHKGPHPEEYHRYVSQQLISATYGFSESSMEYRNAVEETLNRIKTEATTPGHPVNDWLIKR